MLLHSFSAARSGTRSAVNGRAIARSVGQRSCSEFIVGVGATEIDEPGSTALYYFQNSWFHRDFLWQDRKHMTTSFIFVPVVAEPLQPFQVYGVEHNMT